LDDTTAFLETELADFNTLTGTSNLAENQIKMQDDKPTKQRSYPKNPKILGEINAKVDELLQMGFIVEKIRTPPQKYPDYVMDGETLYRNIPHQAGSEDVASWKMCVPKSLRETVLRENHDATSEGHVGSRRVVGRVLLPRHA